MVADLQPDVVVIDLVMPGIGGVEAIRQLRATHDALGIVALSSFSDAERPRSDRRRRQRLPREVGRRRIGSPSRCVVRRHGIYSPQVTHVTPRSRRRGQSLAVDVASGSPGSWPRKTNAEIAGALHLSVFTVKNHVSSILMKLQVRTRTEATALLSDHRTDAKRVRVITRRRSSFSPSYEPLRVARAGLSVPEHDHYRGRRGKGFRV